MKYYNTGGQIGSAVGATATSFIPGVGPLLSPIGGAVGGMLGSLFDKKNKPSKQIQQTVGGYSFKQGGKIPIGGGAQKFVGPSHEQGGIAISPSGDPTNPSQAIAEVEGGETMQDNYIFSDTLKVPGTDMTFAEAHEKLIQENAPPEQIQQLAQMQEQMNGGQSQTPMMEMGAPEVPMGMMAKNGGKLPKYTVGGVAGVQAATDMGLINTKLKNPFTAKRNPYVQAASQIIPSAVDAGLALFTPKPKKTPSLSPIRLPETSPTFANARRNIGAGFRTNPNQTNYAQYISGINELSANEANFRNDRRRENEDNRLRTGQYNIENKKYDADNRAKDTAARIDLMRGAVNRPIQNYRMDEAVRMNNMASIMVGAANIPNPALMQQYIDLMSQIPGIGLKYGGKLRKYK